MNYMYAKFTPVTVVIDSKHWYNLTITDRMCRLRTPQLRTSNNNNIESVRIALYALEPRATSFVYKYLCRSNNEKTCYVTVLRTRPPAGGAVYHYDVMLTRRIPH